MKIHDVLKPYCNLMQDIKIRIEAMKILATNPAGLSDGCVTEFEQLQIRMISETLAVACLLVHGDVEGARSVRLSTAYQADLIIKALEKLHPRFYPQPISPILRDGSIPEIENKKRFFDKIRDAEKLSGFIQIFARRQLDRISSR